jgi:membrane protease subunit HflK
MSQKPTNPFLHDHSSHAHHGHGHDHDHSHDHDLPVQGEIDPAQQSLADALKVSFALLKFVMIGLIIAYFLTGLFYVKEQEMAVRLRFGKIVGEGSARILAPGGPYFSLPYPIEQVLTVPTATQQLTLDKPFWFEVQPTDASKTLEELSGSAARPLNPTRDGSLVTGDANVVHCKWTVSYKITKPVDYLQNVGDPRLAEFAVVRAAEQGVVHTIATLTADQVIKGQGYAELAKLNMQRALDAVGSGVEITNVSVLQPTMPLSVREAYQAVITAENDKAQQLEKANQERAKILGESAGEAWSGLLKLVEQVESAEKDGDKAKLDAAEAALTQALVDLKLPQDAGGQVIGGKVAEMVNDARTYRTQIVEQVRSEADTFRRLLPQFKENPRIVRSRLWQDSKETVLNGDVESIYIPPGQPNILVNRDPAVAKKRQEDKVKADQEAIASGNAGH